ncbi:hypothetical protein PR002_g20607 [Phytophthora rubi]|uniref:Uncharacterized protein n=1 Tax=Phytophthora rubi TaxID=129364 RepID=A0A6A3JJL6_9STRA|nr:hypothetical protein PR002_g20607 [Phytophthora rubi]
MSNSPLSLSYSILSVLSGSGSSSLNACSMCVTCKISLNSCRSSTDRLLVH